MRRMSKTRLIGFVSTASILMFACGESTSPVEQVPASITLVPGKITFNALGETEQLTATVRDALGNVVDTTVVFESMDERVFTVDANGLVTAQAIGLAQATASLGSLTRSSEITVSQVGAQVTSLSGDAQTAVVTTPLGEPLVVRVADARDNPVSGIAVNFSGKVISTV